jgi:hypothetical protein
VRRRMRTNLKNECGGQYMAILASIDIRSDMHLFC